MNWFFFYSFAVAKELRRLMASAVEKQYASIVKELDNKKLQPVYFLQGDEPYYIDAISNYIEQNALSEAEKSFNQTIIYGKDTTFENIVLAAKRFPMMASHQVIIVKEAQHLKDIDALEAYLEAPLESTILVICYKGKKLDKRKKVSKLLAKHVIFDSAKLKDYQLGDWVRNFITGKGKQIDEAAIQLICDYLGADLSKISSEIDKMLINVKDAHLISFKHIEENIGISKEYNVFELQKALGGKNFNKSIQIVNYFASDLKNHPMPLLCANLFGYFNKLLIYTQNKGKSEFELASTMGINKFFIKDYSAAALNYSPDSIRDIIKVIRFYDMRAKGVDNMNTSNSQGQLMIEMIVRILRS